MQTVLIYHTKVFEDSTPDDKDVLEEAKFATEGLEEIGYNVIRLPFGYDANNPIPTFNEILEEIRAIKPAFVFNLVEAINGTDRLAYMAPKIFDELEMPYTGCPEFAFVETQTKTRAKKTFAKNGIPTPYYLTLDNFLQADISNKRFLIKSDTENASKGLESKTYSDREEIRRNLEARQGFFAEEYIEGRELNVSLMGQIGILDFLCIAEMKFENWPNGIPKIVGFDAKWDEKSEAYNKTKRSFYFLESDEKLLASVAEISRKCWNVFNLRGYARVDLRVDEKGNPYVLEINPNPGMGHDSGFVAATERKGMTWLQTLRKIIHDSCEMQNELKF